MRRAPSRRAASMERTTGLTSSSRRHRDCGGQRKRMVGMKALRRSHAVVVAILLAAATTLVAGCGGTSGSSTSSTPSIAQAATAAVSGSSISGAAGSSSSKTGASAGNGQPSTEAAKSHDKILEGKVVQGPAPGTGAGTINDDNSYQAASRADTGKHKGGSVRAGGQIDPCSLVTRSQAESIIGPKLEVHVAPLGPHLHLPIARIEEDCHGRARDRGFLEDPTAHCARSASWTSAATSATAATTGAR